MADSTVARNPQHAPSATTLPGPVAKAKASTKYYAGTMQTVNSSGRATNPTSVSEIVIGVVMRDVDNSAGANDAKDVEFRTGPHRFALHGSNPPTVAELLKPVYASDNQTISKTSSDGSLAGILLGVTSTDCEVWVGPPAATGAVIPGITAPAITDNTGGAAGNGTLAALATPAATAVNPAAPTAYAAVVNMTDPVTKAEGEAVSAALATLRGEVATYELAISALIVDVDALRTLVSTIRDNFADLAAAYNTLRTNLTA